METFASGVRLYLCEKCEKYYSTLLDIPNIESLTVLPIILPDPPWQTSYSISELIDIITDKFITPDLDFLTIGIVQKDPTPCIEANPYQITCLFADKYMQQNIMEVRDFIK